MECNMVPVSMSSDNIFWQDDEALEGPRKSLRSGRMLYTVAPIQQRWEWAQEHMVGPGDILRLLLSFTRKYGPILAAKRATFLATAHPAWEIFGKWLVGRGPAEHGDLYIVRKCLEAGIFMEDTDWMADLFIPSQWASNDPWIISADEPSVYWTLYVRSHVHVLQIDLLRRFHNSTGTNRKNYAYALVALVDFMSKAEQSAYAHRLGMILDKMGYKWDSGNDPERNVAIEVMLRTGVPEPCLNMLMEYALTECHPESLPYGTNPGRPRLAVKLLAVVDPVPLVTLLEGVDNERIIESCRTAFNIACLVGYGVEDTAMGWYNEVMLLLSMWCSVLRKAGKALTEAQACSVLILVARYLTMVPMGVDWDDIERLHGDYDEIRQVCGLALGAEVMRKMFDDGTGWWIGENVGMLLSDNGPP